MKFYTFCLLVALTTFGWLAVEVQAQTYTNFTTIDEPLAEAGSLYGTYVEGISGNVVVGYYYNSQGRHGFYHTLGTTNYTTLDVPAGTSSTSFSTAAYGISGNNIVGWYSATNFTGTYGFIYNIGTGAYATLDDPAGVEEGVSSTEAYGIDGNNVVGSESDNSLPAGSVFGFLCTPAAGQPGVYSFASFYIPIPYRINVSEFSTTNYITLPYGISGDNVVGMARDTDGYSHGFAYNLNTTSLTLLTNSDGGFLWPYGIDGNNVVGYFSDPNNDYNDSGFLCAIGSTNLTTLRDPLGVGGTFAQGISGNAIVGYYRDTSGAPHGFVVGMPTVSISPPVISAFSLAGEEYTLSGTNGVPGAPYAILATTNVALPLNEWTIVDTNSFDGNGAFTFSSAVDPAAPQMFYRLQESQ
ncbi:MAG TPA: hypothetical protein VGH42_10380 [Verrucomicrobiae bacterium]|jgi:hypothetical protein